MTSNYVIGALCIGACAAWFNGRKFLASVLVALAAGLIAALASQLRS